MIFLNEVQDNASRMGYRIQFQPNNPIDHNSSYLRTVSVVVAFWSLLTVAVAVAVAHIFG